MATARKLPSGNYRVLEYSHMENGKRKYASFTAPTKKEAEFMAAVFKAEQHHESNAGPTVSEAIDTYIESKRHVLSPSTIMGYKSIKRNAFPELMKLRSRDLTDAVIQRAVSIHAINHSTKATKNAFALLSSSVSMVYGRKITATFQQKKKKPIYIPTSEQIKDMLDMTQGTAMYTVILMSSAIGWRRSEMCAVEWKDFDFKKKTVRINKALVPDENFNWVLKGPKTESGDRIVTGLPDYLIEHLKTLPRTDKRVITGITPSAISDRFETIRDKLGIKCRLHDLRHYNASIMLALGVPDKYAMERMGHSTTDMLKRVYQHVMGDKSDEVAKSISDKMTETFTTMQHDTQHEGV